MFDDLYLFGLNICSYPIWTALVWPVIWALIKIIAVLLPLLLSVAYLTLWERKAIGFTQIRVGRYRVS